MKLTSISYDSQVGDLISQLVKPGLLLAVADPTREANVMTIGWATYGRIWRQPMCVILVRPSRYTFNLLSQAGSFTVNRMPDGFDEWVNWCGTVSGRNVNKLAERGWTVQNGVTQAAPYITEATLHLECRTVFATKVTSALGPQLLTECYPQDDFHTIFFGQVTGVFSHGKS